MILDQYGGLSKEENATSRYHSMPEEDKQKLKEHKQNRICGMFQEKLQQ